MKNLIALLTAVLLATGCQLIPASDSFASASIPPSTAVTFAPATEARGDRAMVAAAGIQWPTTIIGWLPNWTVAFEGDTDSVFGAETRPATREIVVHVRGRWSDHELARVLAHEICHAIDLTRMTPEQRVAWMAHRGLPTIEWWSQGQGFGWPAEDFAEACSVWLIGGGASKSPWGRATPEQIQIIVTAFNAPSDGRVLP